MIKISTSTLKNRRITIKNYEIKEGIMIMKKMKKMTYVRCFKMTTKRAIQSSQKRMRKGIANVN